MIFTFLLLDQQQFTHKHKYMYIFDLVINNTFFINYSTILIVWKKTDDAICRWKKNITITDIRGKKIP